MKIKIYGSRGTMPLFDRQSLKYGGNTSCVCLFPAGGGNILLDAGTGIAQFAKEFAKSGNQAPLDCDILLSHLHLDHIIGFLGFPQLFARNNIRIYTKSRDDKIPLRRQIFGAFKPPYWPIDFAEIVRAELHEISDGVPFSLGAGVTVMPFAARHPDSTSAFRISDEKSGKTVVYLMDYEIDENDSYDALVAFCQNADLVILDACYLPSDYPARRGWGHSTYLMGAILAAHCGCAKMVLSHFAQEYSDTVLDEIAREVAALSKNDKNILLGFDGMELDLCQTTLP